MFSGSPEPECKCTFGYSLHICERQIYLSKEAASIPDRVNRS